LDDGNENASHGPHFEQAAISAANFGWNTNLEVNSATASAGSVKGRCSKRLSANLEYEDISIDGKLCSVLP